MNSYTCVTQSGFYQFHYCTVYFIGVFQTSIPGAQLSRDFFVLLFYAFTKLKKITTCQFVWKNYYKRGGSEVYCGLYLFIIF